MQELFYRNILTVGILYVIYVVKWEILSIIV